LTSAVPAAVEASPRAVLAAVEALPSASPEVLPEAALLAVSAAAPALPGRAVPSRPSVPLTQTALPTAMTEVASATPSRAGVRAPTVQRLGIASVLVALGFAVGRLTAPSPSETLAVGASPPVETVAATTISPTPPAPVPPAAIPPALVTASPPAAVQTTLSAPPDLGPIVKPPVAAAVTIVPPAPSPPRLAADSLPPRRPVAAGARSVPSTPTAEAIPTPPATPQVSSFVQAVQDDIAEDEASRKKR
jgi:hypothetical protein